MTRALVDVETLRSNNTVVGVKWMLLHPSPTLAAAEQAVKEHIVKCAAPGYQLPLGWAEERLPEELDKRLQRLYAEMIACSVISLQNARTGRVKGRRRA